MRTYPSDLYRVSTFAVFAPALALVLGASVSRGTTLDLSWTDCAPITTDLHPTSTGVFAVTASCIGQSEPHHAFGVFILIGDAQDQVPDAWRFDAAGCNSIGVPASITPSPALGKTCPAFCGNAPILPTYYYGFPFVNDPAAPTLMMAGAIVSYDPINTPNPNQRYFLARFVFNHTYSVVGPGEPGVSCGGLERTIFLRAFSPKSAWVSQADQEIPFGVGNGTLVFHGEGISPTPARARTWGQLKNQYRM